VHHDITKRLFDAFPPDRKADFWAGYLYLKYTEHFFNYSLEASGQEPRKDLPKLDESIELMLQAINWHVGEAAMSTETSLYHGKVVKLQDALKLITQERDVHLSPPERVIPFKIARDVILENPSSIVVGTCPCRAASQSPCLPPGQQEVCLFLGDPWASFMDEQNPKYHKISQQEAVKVVDSCHDRGFVHTAYFEHAVGNRLDALCNCCSCCCLGVKMWNLLDGAVPLLAPSGYVAEITEECSGCGVCADDVCHFQAISMDEAGDRAVIDFERCMGCGICTDRCPEDAIHSRRESSKGDPLDLEELLEQR
jgi:Pyruvate/2-oxoacid:ferredoxin oxidoreductase delta subunit